MSKAPVRVCRTCANRKRSWMKTVMCCNAPMGGEPDPHSKRALELFGEVTPETRRRAKIINYAEAYGSGQISLSRTSGQYPLERTKT